MTTSEQARADAMADAETLRMFPALRYHREELANAESQGMLCALFIRRALVHRRSSITQPVRFARDAAHAAFRAVPGLKG
jgi:hypothetical protein